MTELPRDLVEQELQRLAFRAVLAEAVQRRGLLVLCVVAALLAIGVAQLTADAWLGTHGTDRLLLAGAVIPLRVVQGEWWRLFTGPLLHADWSHLLLNVIALFVVGRPIEAAFGHARFWLIYAGAGLAGAMGTVTSSVALPVSGHPAAFVAQMATAPLSVGASASVFGLVAALVAFGLKLWPRLTPGLRKSLIYMPALVLAAMLLMGGLAGTGVDNMAHIGGTAGGLALGLVLRPQLRGVDGGRLPWSAWARPLAWLAGGLVVAAVAMSILRIGQPLDLPPVRPAILIFQGQRMAYPADGQRGLVRGGRCRKEYVDPVWALQTGRTPCWLLPLDGVLILGRRDKLMTLDTEDLDALRLANRTGRFAWRQPDVMVHPVGDRWMYLVLAPESLLPSQVRALQPLLPPPGSGRVSEPLQPGDPQWQDWLRLPS
jgi:membrane associated rhomboid family serine protease